MWGNEFKEIFARLDPGRWNQVIVPINCEKDLQSLFEKHKKIYVKQMKFDPFGTRLSEAVGKNERTYISSVTFLKKLSGNEVVSADNDTERINLVLELMNNNLKSNQALDFYAERVFLSVSRFREWFRQQTGISPYKYILYKKIEYAKLCIVSTELQISEIAAVIGFTDAHYFSRLFKKYTGMSPKQFKKSKDKN